MATSSHPSARMEDAQAANQLIVYRHGKRVGVLTRDPDGRGTRFQYTRNGGASSRSVKLSYTEESISAGKGKDLPPFFSNLLPEGKRRESLASALGISYEDEFSLIAAVGGDTIGDVTLVPRSRKDVPHLAQSVAVDGVLQDEDLEEMLLQASNPTSPGFDPTSIPGIQNKVARFLSSFVSNTPVSGHNANIYPSVIIKCEDGEKPHLVENETYCLGLARRAGLITPRHLSLSDKEGRRALVLERFDRLHDSHERVHVEDGCQLMGKAPEEKYNVSFERLTRAVCDVATDPDRAAREMLRRYAFAYVVADGDLHAKNISVWTNPQTKEVELTPTYDTVCTAIYKDHHMALLFDGKKKNIKMENFQNFGKRFGIPEHEVEAIVNDVAQVVNHELATGGFKQIGLDEKETSKLERFLADRLARLELAPVQGLTR